MCCAPSTTLALRGHSSPGQRLVVIGAGFLGCEVAASAQQVGVHVSVVDPLPVPMLRQLGDEVGRHVASLHRDRGVDMRCGEAVHRLLGDHGVTGVELASGEALPADVVLVAIGSTPATDWLTDSGLDLEAVGVGRPDHGDRRLVQVRPGGDRHAVAARAPRLEASVPSDHFDICRKSGVSLPMPAHGPVAAFGPTLG